MFINAEPLFGVIPLYRLVWIGGRLGGYKTSLAFRIAKDYLDTGYRLVTNSSCVWADDYRRLELNEDGHLKVVVVLDEGGLEFKASRQIEEIAAYAAKMDVVYILPSFFPPVRTAQLVTIQPIFNFKAAGVPLIVYRWRIKLMQFEDKGVFFWYDPSEIYGIYSRQDPGARTASIVQFLLERKEDYRRRFGYADELSGMEEVTPTELLTDAVDTFAAAADQIASFPVRKYKCRR